MLHPTAVWIDLPELVRRRAGNLTLMIEKNGARACGSLVERKYILHLVSLDAFVGYVCLQRWLCLGLIQKRSASRRKEWANKPLVRSAAHKGSDQGSEDRSPPVTLR